jgi:hypothetical protein
VDATGIFIGEEKTKRGELNCSTHITMKIAKYSDKITWDYWPCKESHYLLETWKCLITDGILDDIF